MHKSSYGGILKATAIFGSVQVFSILVNIIRSKVIAVFLGPAGVGINSLLTSTIGLIGTFSNMGLTSSAVKNVAAAHASGDSRRVGKIVSVFRGWVWLTGLFAFTIALVLSPWLSRVAFNSEKYTYAFVLISVTLLINQISAGQGVVLRGMRKINYTAKSSMIGAAAGLITSSLLYYFLRERGIVPAIIISSMTGLCLTWFFSRKIRVEKVPVDRTLFWDEGKEMLLMGIMMTLAGLISTATAYLLRIFISKTGSVADVGLYNAGFAIINSYVGLIFTSLSADYFPRLSAVAMDHKKAASEINQQAEVALLIMAPIICVFLVYINYLVILLYSEKFTPINTMVHWLALGMFFKLCSWAVAYLILARGATKIYFWNELIANVYILLFNIVGYHYWGLNGLGISFLVGYLVYTAQVIVLTGNLYKFYYDGVFVRLFLVQLTIGVLCFFVQKLLVGFSAYLIGTVLIVCSSVYSLFELNKRLDFKKYINKFKKSKSA